MLTRRAPISRVPKGFRRNPSGGPAWGFSLLGLLVAAGMTVVIAAAVVGLAERAGQARRVTKARLLAIFLAREGIELVRVVRDGHWLTTPRCPEVGACTIFWRGQTTAGPTALCTVGGRQVYRLDADTISTDGLLPDSPGSDTTLLSFEPTTGAYRHGGGVPTPFRRWVVLESADDPGCGQPSTFLRPPPPGGNLPPASLTVRSFVTWARDPVAACAAGRECVAVAEELSPWMAIR